MSALSDLGQTSETTSTTMPSWYSTAVQNVGKDIGNTTSSIFANTTGGQAAQNAFGTSGAFAQGQNALSTIASGAANPWNVDASGNVTANNNTALGGLYTQSMNQLNQILPQITGQADAGSIAGGGFGSLRGQTATNLARGNALANVNQQMAEAALKNQQTGATAGAALGNLGNQQVTQALNTSTAEQNSPFTTAMNQANVLKTLAPGLDQTATKTATGSTLNNLIGAGTLTNGGLNSLFGTSGVLGKMGITGLSGAVINNLGDLWKAFGSSGTTDTGGGGGGGGGDGSDPTFTTNSDGDRVYTDPATGAEFTENSNGEFVNDAGETYNFGP
jgi:hypothetical protein